MPDRMVREAARFSTRLEKISPQAELMFWRLITVPDDYGIYYADPAQLRAAIWPTNPRNIRTTEVARWRDELAAAGIIAAFEVEGVRYIELLRFGQADKLKHPRRRHPAPPSTADDPAQLKMALDEPPVPKPKRREEKGESGARRHTPTPESQEVWLARLRDQHPHLDIDAQLRAWLKYCQKQGKQGDRNHFEKHWLANLGLPVQYSDTRATGATSIEPEPEAWRMYLKDRYEGEEWAETAGCLEWSALPANWRAKICREMAKAG
jgi:hypothetical protein